MSPGKLWVRVGNAPRGGSPTGGQRASLYKIRLVAVVGPSNVRVIGLTGCTGRLTFVTRPRASGRFRPSWGPGAPASRLTIQCASVAYFPSLEWDTTLRRPVDACLTRATPITGYAKSLPGAMLDSVVVVPDQMTCSLVNGSGRVALYALVGRG